jgi:outer membrane protein assembly factor BamB
MMPWRKLLLFVGVVLVLSACSSSDDEELVPDPVPEIEGTLQLKPLWTRSTDAEVEGVFTRMQPAIDGDKVFVAGTNGRVVALALDSGKILWEKELDVPTLSGVAARDGLVVVGGRDGEVIALNSATGEELWRNLVSSETLAPAAIGENKVVVRSGDGKLFALDSKTGKREWFFDRTVPVLTLRGTSAPIITHGAVVAGFDTGKVSLFLLRDGRPIWERQIAQAAGRSELERIVDMDTKPLLLGQVLYVVSYNGNVAALDLKSGQPLWQRDMSSYQDMATDGRRIFLSTAEDEVRALDRTSGTTLWVQSVLHRRQLTAPAAVGDFVVVGDFEGYLYWMDVSDGHFVKIDQWASEGFSGPFAVQGRYLVAQGKDGSVVAFLAPPTTYK